MAEKRTISRDLLAQLTQELDDKTVEILIYHYLDGMNQGEIASLLSVSRRAIVKRLTVARRVLDALLEGRS